jgi:hypothetical protein
MLNVFITVDTEIWPRHPDWRSAGLDRDYLRDIGGRTDAGDFGIAFQMDLLNRHGLKGVFFVEALFASEAGPECLKRMVGLIQDAGHEVQLHVHTEWLAWFSQPLFDGKQGQNIRCFSESEQTLILERALENLRSSGARNVCAFRAGNYGANFDTLRALHSNGLRFDTSYNACYLDSTCGLGLGDPLLQPREIHGVVEVPVSFFRDWPGHYRHTQLCACSASELEWSLEEAWRQGWYSYVLVSHGFELLRERKQIARPPRPDIIVIKRFERLCRFLGENKDKYRTSGFAEIDVAAIPDPPGLNCLRSRMTDTAGRMVEQAFARVF